MDKNLLQQIRVDMNAALAAVAKKHRLSKLAAGNCSYDPAGCFTFKVEGVTGGGLDKDAARYEANRSAWPRLPKVGSVFQSKGARPCKIVGMTAGGKVIFEKDGGRFVIEADALQQRHYS